MGKRREQRPPIVLTVRVSGMDSNGQLFTIPARTLDVTTLGARLEGITCRLHRGASIVIQCGTRKARFRVTWVGPPNTTAHDQIGVRIAEPGRHIWGQPIARDMGDGYDLEPGQDMGS
ncbi:MAG TPA: hypothetical protein VD837_16525 [Terriglobales bacterium]|nr:hypothetical protein [Terriglobales bacterium]